MKSTKLLVGVVLGIILLAVGGIMNPFSWNDAGNRTVVEQAGGRQFVEFTPGIFYAGFAAKETEWPNQISVTYQADVPGADGLKDNGIEIGKIKIMFNDGTTADAEVVDQKLGKIIDVATKSAVSRQELMTAQQQTLTAKAKGEQALVEIEYTQKQEQTKQVVAAQTLVEVAKQDRDQQKIQAEAATFEATKRRTLADVAAYEKSTAIKANNGLEQKLEAYVEVQKAWADGLSKYKGNITPLVQGGSMSGQQGDNGVNQLMQLLTAKTAKELALDIKIDETQK